MLTWSYVSINLCVRFLFLFKVYSLIKYKSKIVRNNVNNVATNTSITIKANINTIKMQKLINIHNIEIILLSSNLKNLSYLFSPSIIK